MKHYLLRFIKESDGVYEHKLCVKLGKEYGNFPELEQLIFEGFIERLPKEKGFIIKGLYLTDTGKMELARLDAIPPAPRVLSSEQLRFQELKSKLKDNTIIPEEQKELLKIFFRV